MPSVPAVTQPTTNATTTATGTPRVAKKTLDQQDFLKLLTLQFQSQDPLKPMDDTSFLAQMAQFTSLQQVSTLTTEIDSMRSDQQKLASTSYLGRMVTMDTGDGRTVTGAVTSVDTSGATPQLKVGGTYYPLSSLLSVTTDTLPSPTADPTAA